VTNGLGTATVTWNLEIIDVNEPPYFLNTPYTKAVVEYQSISSSILQIEWADPDTQLDYRTVQITSKGTVTHHKGEGEDDGVGGKGRGSVDHIKVTKKLSFYHKSQKIIC
jgi:hypothetical protein